MMHQMEQGAKSKIGAWRAAAATASAATTALTSTLASATIAIPYTSHGCAAQTLAVGTNLSQLWPKPSS